MSISSDWFIKLLDYRNPRENDWDIVWHFRRFTAQIPIGLNNIAAAIETIAYMTLLCVLTPAAKYMPKRYAAINHLFQVSLITTLYGSIAFITGLAMRSITVDTSEPIWTLNLDEHVDHPPSRIRKGAKELKLLLKENPLDDKAFVAKLLENESPFYGLTFYHQTGKKKPEAELKGTFKAYLTAAKKEIL